MTCLHHTRCRRVTEAPCHALPDQKMDRIGHRTVPPATVSHVTAAENRSIRAPRATEGDLVQAGLLARGSSPLLRLPGETTPVALWRRTHRSQLRGQLRIESRAPKRSAADSTKFPLGRLVAGTPTPMGSEERQPRFVNALNIAAGRPQGVSRWWRPLRAAARQSALGLTPPQAPCRPARPPHGRRCGRTRRH